MTLEHSVVLQVLSCCIAGCSVNVLVFLMTAQENACDYENQCRKRKADESRWNCLKKVVRICVIERELHHSDEEHERIVKPVAVLEDEDRLSDYARVVVHKRRKFLCRDYKPCDYKAEWNNPVEQCKPSECMRAVRVKSGKFFLFFQNKSLPGQARFLFMKGVYEILKNISIST